MVMICPYCDTEINEKQMEAEDGCCPECGAVLTQSNILSDPDDPDNGDGYDDYDDDDDDYSAFGERSRDYPVSSGILRAVHHNEPGQPCPASLHNPVA